MVNAFRKHHQTLMILVTIMVIIAFVFLYNTTKIDQLGKQFAFSVYGQKLTQADIERVVMRYQLAKGVGLSEFVYSLSGGSSDENQGLSDFVFGTYVLDHEAKRLGITPTSSEVRDAFMALPVFQTNNAFDPEKYKAFLVNRLAPNGFTDVQFEDLVRDSLRLKRLKEVVGSTVDVSAAEFRSIYAQQYQKMAVSLIPFTLAEFTSAIQPTDEEVAKFYEDRKSTLNTEEKRSVDYVTLALGDAEKGLTGTERVKALQKMSNQANDFVQEMLKPNAQFAEVAKKLGLTAKSTSEFTETAPAPEFTSAPGAVAAAFQLTEKDPNSEPVKFENGFHILHLGKIVPRRPLTLEEAKPKIVQQLKNEKGREAMLVTANAAQAKIAEALKAGKSLAEAAKEAGRTVETYPSFSIAEPATDKPNAQSITEKAIELAEGGLSDFTATEAGGFIIRLDKREPIDEAKFEKDSATQLEGFRTHKRFMAFIQWLQVQRKAANIQSLGEQRRDTQQQQQQQQ